MRPSPPLISTFFFLLTRPPPRSTLFPYTTLFRSLSGAITGGSIPPAERFRYRRLRPCLRPHRAGSSISDRKSTRLNSSHVEISYAVFCLKKKKKTNNEHPLNENRASYHRT